MGTRRTGTEAGLVLGVFAFLACADTPAEPARDGPVGPTTALVLVSSSSTSPSELCTYADARVVFNNFLGSLRHGLRSANPSSLTEAFTQCQYRLFFDGETIVFRSGDVFLGGVNVNWDFETLDALGATRAEAIADLQAQQTRVWLAPLEADGSIGELVEQTLERTPYKNGISPSGRRVVQQHRAFITSLPPGEYVSVFEATWDEFRGFPAGGFQATVRLVITP